MQSKSQPIKAFFLSLLALILFYLSFFIAYLIICGILEFLYNFPIIWKLLSWFYNDRINPPEWILAIICPFISRFVASFVMFLLSKNNAKTLGVSETMLGIYLIIINIVFIVLNIAHKEFSSIITNVCVLIAGFSLMNSGREDRHSS